MIKTLEYAFTLRNGMQGDQLIAYKKHMDNFSTACPSMRRLVLEIMCKTNKIVINPEMGLRGNLARSTVF